MALFRFGHLKKRTLESKAEPSGRGPTTASLFVQTATKRLVKNAFLLAEGISFAKFLRHLEIAVVKRRPVTGGPAVVTSIGYNKENAFSVCL